jgi:hypothetical protein
MEQEFLRERIENEAKAVVNNFQRNQYGANGYNNGYNYYGTPYHNPYTYTDYNKYQTRLDEMKEEARERRIRLNINLSKLAHNVCGETYDENVIEEIADVKIMIRQLEMIYDTDDDVEDWIDRKVMRQIERLAGKRR